MAGARSVTASVALAMTLVTGLVLAGCGGKSGPPGDAGSIDLGRVGELSDADAREVAASVNAFGFDLHDALADGSGNVVISPLSVASLLAMIAAGAGSDTARQMAEVLHLEEVRDDRFAALLLAVSDTDEVVVSVANALWADEGVPFEQDYLDFAREVFGATVEQAALGERAVVGDVDDWVSERTGGLIEQVAADLGLPDPQAALVLVNAVYFLGGWSVQFDPERTRQGPFTLSDGAVVEVPTMHRASEADEPVEVAERDGYQVLRLPYGDDERYAMDVFLPDVAHDLRWLLDELDAGERTAALAGLTSAALDVALPKFELEWDATLNDTLAALGMELPFASTSDFTPMSPSDPFLSTVVHKTFIRVDEEGTEAAAVTGGSMATSAPPSFTVDRPFLFSISDSLTDTILFLGTIEDPRG